MELSRERDIPATYMSKYLTTQGDNRITYLLMFVISLALIWQGANVNPGNK